MRESLSLRSNFGRAKLAALGLILLLGFALRVHDLGVRSLWEDEGWTMLLSQGPGLDDVVRTLADDQHPPLYFVLFRVWRSAAGETEFGGRFFGVLIGLVGVAAGYPLGRALYSAQVGVLAALLLALADLPIDLAQEIRHYSLMLTLGILSSLFYVRAWRAPTRGNRVGHVLASIALLYTHYLGAFILGVQGAHWLLTARPLRRLLAGLVPFAAIGVGFLPWLPVMLAQNRVRWANPLYYQNALPNSPETFRAVRTAVLGQHYALLAGLALLGLVYLTYPRGEQGPAGVRIRLRPAWPALFLTVWIALVVMVTVVVNARQEFLTVRNFVIIVPPLLLLAAHGLSNLERTARLFLTAMLVVIGLTTVDARRFYPDWRAVTQNVTRLHLAGEPVLMDVWVGDFPVRYYVRRQMGADTPALSLREWRDAYREQFLPHLLETIRPLPAFWLIYWGDAPMTEYGQLIADAGFTRTAALAVDHLGTPLYSYRFDKLPAETRAQFGDLFALRQAFAPPQLAPGVPLDVALWWEALTPPPLDYSVSVVLQAADGYVAAQYDAALAHAATSGWQPGAVHFERDRLDVPASLAPGTYMLAVKLYWYGDQQPLPVTAQGQPVGAALTLGTYDVRRAE